MAEESLFCASAKIPFLESCMTMAEWSATWQSVGIGITLCIAIGTLLKYIQDKTVAQKQELESRKLERIKFFLDQSRRLFDDPDLRSVLKHIDGDDPELADPSHWDNNRKFLVFIEEIELLIRSRMLDDDACQYMFGYYANRALEGDNFKSGIDFKEEHWKLFTEFARRYDNFLAKPDLGASFEKLTL